MLYVYIHLSIKQKRGTCVTSEPSYNNYLITSACTDKLLTAIAVYTIGNRDKLNSVDYHLNRKSRLAPLPMTTCVLGMCRHLMTTTLFVDIILC